MIAPAPPAAACALPGPLDGGPSAELRLLLACCETPRAGAETLASLVDAVVDWDEFDRLTGHHRVPGFVHHALSSIAGRVPEPAWRRITEQARRNADQNLRNLAEEIRIDRALRANGIAPLFLKGASLGMKLYGNLTTKSSWDIDAVVPVERARDSAEVLRSLGYASTGFGGIDSGPMFDRFLAVAMESIWRDEARGTYVELHSRMADHSVLLDGLVGPPGRQTIAASGSETLEDRALFAYLCVHGTMHNWERLKWLADVGALVGTSPHGPEELLAAAQRAGAGRPAMAALALCAQWLRHALPSQLVARCRADPAAQRLMTFGGATLIASGRGERHGMLSPIRTWWIQLAAVDGMRRKVAFTWSILTGLRWPFQLRLPRWSWPVAAILVSPVRLYRRWLRLRELARPR